MDKFDWFAAAILVFGVFLLTAIVGQGIGQSEYAKTCRSAGGVPHEELCLNPAAMSLVPLGFEKEDY